MTWLDLAKAISDLPVTVLDTQATAQLPGSPGEPPAGQLLVIVQRVAGKMAKPYLLLGWPPYEPPTVPVDKARPKARSSRRKPA